jgi:hypothetical protein
LLQANVGIRAVKLYQHLAGQHALGIVSEDGDHRTGHLRRDRHLVTADIRIVCCNPG